MKKNYRSEVGTSAIKAILILGMLSFAGLLLFSWGMRRSLRPNEKERVRIRQAYSPFTQAGAQRSLDTIWAWNSLEEGLSPTLLNENIKKELSAMGRPVQLRHVPSPSGARTEAFTVHIKGTRNGAIHLVSWCLPLIQDETLFLGGNAACAPAAFFLEVARSFPATRQGRSLVLTLLVDPQAKKVRGEKGPLRGLKGFIDLVMKDQRAGHKADLILALAMPGDCYFRVMQDQQAPEWLSELLWDTAFRLNYRRHFVNSPRLSGRLAMPTTSSSPPALLICDSILGGSLLTHQKTFLTREDGLEGVCTESLQAIADVLYHALAALDGALNQAAFSGAS